MKILRAGAIALLTAFLLYMFFRNINFSQVWGIIRRVHPGYLLLFCAGLLFQQVLRGYRWAILLRPRKATIRVVTLVNFTMIGFLINTLLPGRIGEPARGILVARREGIKSAHGLASVVLERLIDASVVVCLFLISLLYLKHTSSPFIASLRQVAWVALPLFMGAFILFYFMNRESGFAWTSRQITRLMRILPAHRREQAAGTVLHFIQGLRLQLGTLDFIKLTLSSFAVWLCTIPVYWAMLRPMGIQASFIEAMNYYSILAAAASIPTPGMAGSLDAASRGALVSILGANPNSAVAYTLVMHVLLILVLVIAGFIALTVEGVNLKGIRRIQEKT
ncbi:MAG TPA: flippase-like domain-containing protein [Candidatus Aminicenantes bacterium]|nr:flippase-like domain-containing protein [Candidatus Aminicenantes bacterium]